MRVPSRRETRNKRWPKRSRLKSTAPPQVLPHLCLLNSITMPTATLIRCAAWRCGSTSYPTSVVVAVPSDGESSRSNHEVNNSIIPKVQGPKKKPVVKKSQPDVKVSIRTRKKCSQKGCINGAVKGGVCVTHGAMTKRCTFEGCTNGAVRRGVCWTHGAKREVKRCSFKGCTNGVVRGGVCVTHGAMTKRCTFEGCNNQAKKGGVCVTHGAKCSHKGCTNQVVKGGVCITHGAKTKRCSHQGCTNRVVKGGLCWTHGANAM